MIERTDDPRDDRFEIVWRETELPYLEVRLHRPREVCILKGSKPKATGQFTPWAVEVTTGPASFAPATGDPRRLREMARALLDAADELDLRTALTPGLPLGLETT